jgi:hypothetical protein
MSDQNAKASGQSGRIVCKFICSFLNCYSTFSPISSKEKIIAKLEEVADELESEMRENGWVGHTITLKFKLDTFQGNLRHSPPLLILIFLP